jgi:hypothetical protein
MADFPWPQQHGTQSLRLEVSLHGVKELKSGRHGIGCRGFLDTIQVFFLLGFASRRDAFATARGVEKQAAQKRIFSK